MHSSSLDNEGRVGRVRYDREKYFKHSIPSMCEGPEERTGCLPVLLMSANIGGVGK
jgi:hypothetical protein